mmetsp:Transcript_59258/g.190653  ORF Transcript_59258/g.190653 Transcript_59258/m.190653 type:complete len:867 (-) Transcript_59258:86-2686(-)
MSNPDAALLLMSLHGSLLRLASSKLGKHVQGLPVAAKELAKESMISNKLRRQMTNVDTTVSYLRHVTQALCTEVVRDLEKARTAPSGCPGAGPPPAPSSRGPSRPAGPAQQAPRAAKVRVTGKPFDLPNGPEHGAEVRETGKPNVPPNVPEHVAEEQQMLQAARPLAQGCTQEQAQLYVQQYMQQQQQQHQQQQQQQQQAAAAAAAAQTPLPDPSQLMATAMAQGYTQEQAQMYVHQYLQQQQLQQQQLQLQQQLQRQEQQQATQAQELQGKQRQEEKVALYASTPQILNIEEGRKSQYRSTLKAVVFDTNNGRRIFQDIFVKGPWRRRREEAQKDQEELSTAFKYDGKQGVEKKQRELEDKVWRSEELEDIVKSSAGEGGKTDALEDDDFDAEAESDAEPEPEVAYEHEELPVKVRGLGQPDGPIQSWEEGVARGCIAPQVAQALWMMQMQRPTLIQRFALPLIARSNCDVLAQAQTGSGKTLAFVIPIISRLLASPPVARPFFPGQMAQASPVALMLSPTRELAIQTAKNTSDLLQQAGSSMTVLTMYGGETLSQQIKPIEKQNMDIICATPGRLLDAIDSGKVSLMFATVVVLDEADQMLDLAVGLEGTVTQITDGRDLPRNDGRQTLLFSATMPDYQTKQFHSVLKAPPSRVKLRVGHYTEDERGGSCRHITQNLVRVRDMDERWQRLGRDLMEVWGSTTQRRAGKGIMFTNRIALAMPLEQALRRCGISCGQLHGKQTQDVREDVVKRFRNGEYEMLIASNVASRGLDFPDIRLVVQFELPKTVEIYTHRIGRTGRNGQSGVSLAYYLDRGDQRLAKPLAEFLRLNAQVVPSWLEEIVEPGSRRQRSRSRSRGRDHRSRGW